MNPLFVCNGIDTTEPNACLDLRKCSITNDFTAVFRNELYCEKQNIRSTIQSIFALGLVIGMIVMPILGDIFGRRIVLLLVFATGITAMSTLLIAIQNNLDWLMIVGSTLTGIFGSGMTIMGFILTCDFCTEKLRQKCLLIYCSIWGITQMTFYPIYQFMNSWNKYLIITLLIPSALLFILVLYLKI